jgi:hypothetical protein
MDDDRYVAGLFAILTDPNPPGVDPDDPYRQSSDGVDRYDGFGTEVRVESITRVPGRYGEELEVGFVLDVPPDETRVPARGSLRVLFDGEWRRLNGYEDPATYAPLVAQRVWWAAHEHVVRYRDRGGRPRVSPDSEESWQRLLVALAEEGSLVVTGPGRATVTVHDPGERVVTVVIAPGEAFDVPFDDPVAHGLDDDEHYLVAFDGALRGSTREELPPVRGRARERRMREAGRSGGQWYAHRPGTDGR